MDKMKEAQGLLESGKQIFMATISEGGRPNGRTISSVISEGLTTIWMLTGKSTQKYLELSANPECMIYAAKPGDGEDYLELRLWGRVELFDDAESRASVWRDDYIVYFPGGKDDTDLAVLKFTAASGILQAGSGIQALSF